MDGFRMATVLSYSSTSHKASLKLDGDDASSGKLFKVNSSISLSANDRVLCAFTGGTYVVLCKIS